MPTDAKEQLKTGKPVAQEGELLYDRELDDLFWGVVDAARMRPPAWGASVLGWPSSWLPSRSSPYSEYRFAYSWSMLRTAKYVADVMIPSLPLTAPEWFPEPLAPLFWHPSGVRQHPDHDDSWTSHPDEAWLFINGILTNDEMAHLNVDYLADLFHRPITLLENSTGGWFQDLLECAREKSFGRNAEATEKTFPAIYDALKDPRKRRVVLIAHSQGTIIAAAVLRLLALIYQSGQGRPAAARNPIAARKIVRDAGVKLDPTDFEPLDGDELGKLELYCFANCATEMRYIDRTADGPLPWIESYGNQFDLVARLGMLAPNAQQRGVVIDGPCYEHKGAWGHLLNRHYLTHIDVNQRQGRKRGPVDGSATPYMLINAGEYPAESQPRLYRYLNGGAPITPGAAAAQGNGVADARVPSRPRRVRS